MIRSNALYAINNNHDGSISLAIIQDARVIFILVDLSSLKLMRIAKYDKNFPELTVNFETEDNNVIKNHVVNEVKIIGEEADIRKLIQEIGFSLFDTEL